MKRIFLSLALIISSSAWAGPAVLFEDIEVPGVPKESYAPNQNQRKKTSQSEITPLSQRNTLRSTYENQSFDSTEELRTKRRVGFGASAAGTTGLMGAFLELNLTPSSSVITAFGGGPGFNAFNLQWKHLFTGQSFSPYMGVGYARWYNASSSEKGYDRTTPSVLGAHFLTSDQKKTGEFAVDLLTPNIGIQYNQLYGEYAGVGVFAEVEFLTQLSDLTPIPTGGVGVLYYF